tara:strand:+ start:1582 stop:2652 length:1071 start_codon:yes stop_codon:yes gene_type:complete
MFTQGFGEVLTDVMTVNPALSGLPGASSILDASNYTFQAVTFGKDAAGFNGFHAHQISSITETVSSTQGASSYDRGRLGVFNLGGSQSGGASSYYFSSTYYQYSSTYNSVPNYPSVADTRLERGSTKSSNLSDHQHASALPDLGHYPNAAIDPLFSSVWNKVGGFAPSTTFQYIFYNGSTSAASASLTGNFNKNAVMDKNGYLTINDHPASAVAGIGTGSRHGAVLVSGTDPTNAIASGSLQISLIVSGGDAASLAAFGGVKHIGVYCLDLKELLASGLLPPYDWNALNNIRKYKLVSKSTFLENALYHRDYAAGGGLVAASGFKILTENAHPQLPSVQAFAGGGGPRLSLLFNFK